MVLDLIHVLNKIHPKNPFTTLVLKYICNFFKFCDMYYFFTNIFHTFKFFIIFWIKFFFD
jgi:hypothetical protein